MSRRLLAGLVLALLAGVSACGGGSRTDESAQRTPAPKADELVCDRSASPASLEAEFEAAAAGTTICLEAGDYGVFKGAAKDGPVTIGAQPGTTATIGIDFRGARGITLRGLTISGAQLAGETRDITIRGSRFTGFVTVDGLVDANIVLDGNEHLDIDTSEGSSPARIHLGYGGAQHSGVTIRNSLFAGGDADGIQSGVGVDIIGNEFRDILQKGPNHTDAIQLMGAIGAVVRGNYIHDTATGIVAYNGLERVLIEDNAIDLTGTSKRPWGIEIHGDNGSTIRHNTVYYAADCAFNLPCGMIDVGGATDGTVVSDNILTDVTTGEDMIAAHRKHNLVRQGAAPGDRVGVPTYAGGARPTTYAGFRLAPTSEGRKSAADGSDPGISAG